MNLIYACGPLQCLLLRSKNCIWIFVQIEKSRTYNKRVVFAVFLYKVAYMKFLKVQPCKFYNNKFIMIASTKITNTDIFEFITVLVFKLFSSKFLFINRKENRNC